MKQKKKMDTVQYEELSPTMKREVDKIDAQIDSTQANLAQINVDTKPHVVADQKVQTEASRSEILKYDAPYIKPVRSMPACSRAKPEQEKMRKAAWEYIRCIVENYEVRGESVQFWYCPPLSGEQTWEWIIPVNIPVWIPRMVAEHLSTRSYNRIVMQDSSHKMQGEMGRGATITPTELIAVERRKRIDCRPTDFMKHDNLFKAANA